MDGDPVWPSSNLCILYLLYIVIDASLIFCFMLFWSADTSLIVYHPYFPKFSEFATNWDVFWIVYHQWGNGSVEGSSGLRGLLGVGGSFGGHGKIVNFSNNNFLSRKNWHTKKALKRLTLAKNALNWRKTPEICTDPKFCIFLPLGRGGGS